MGSRPASRERRRKGTFVGMRDNKVLLRPTATRTHPTSVSNANPMTECVIIELERDKEIKSARHSRRVKSRVTCDPNAIM